MAPLNRLKHLNTKECLWVYVLKILSERPTHPYVIRKEIQERFGFKPGTMTAYKVLYLLGRKNLVKKTKKGRKNVYKITESGKNALKKAIMFYKSRIELLK